MKKALFLLGVFTCFFSSLTYGDKLTEFNGEKYNDDRMFVLHIAKCTVIDDNETDEIITVYHQKIPENFKWCVITYRNTAKYMPFRIDYFDAKEDATKFLKATEPLTPLISIEGRTYNPPPTYEEFYEWKKRNNFEEYDYKKIFLKGDDPRETIVQKKH